MTIWGPLARQGWAYHWPALGVDSTTSKRSALVLRQHRHQDLSGRVIWNLTALRQDRTVQISAEEGGGVAVPGEKGEGAGPMRRLSS